MRNFWTEGMRKKEESIWEFGEKKNIGGSNIIKKWMRIGREHRTVEALGQCVIIVFY